MRPSLVFGPEDQLFNRFAALARIAPVMPLVGGNTKFQPVYVGDLAAAIAAAAAGAGHPGTTYEIGGPEIMTFRGIIDRAQRWASRSKPNFPMPFWLAKLAAVSTVALPNAWRPLTVDQVRMLSVDNVVSEAAVKEGRTLAAFGIDNPHSADAIVPDYLVRFQPKGQFAQYRG
jgi:NADH dehydrogenase